jgi:hypothetical protein
MSVIDIRENKADGLPATERIYDLEPLLGLRVPDPMRHDTADGDDELDLYFEESMKLRREPR